MLKILQKKKRKMQMCISNSQTCCMSFIMQINQTANLISLYSFNNFSFQLANTGQP